ncbi:hypothetical protein [Bradyrhizobium sp. BR 10289]|uniref:hypothetical protein n=1 Tax=Bradyrhizobium sp. BR 10289 TaxID=2749993 RepID=UPI001C646579|nr:hypothetical protein [Bradyrhizobium sp. BR 10289]MBW7968155.1 hypothetical protein [Bradyrhizobium sp. BR 10289]
MARPLRVCDHALLRFIERVGGLDVEGLRRHLAESLNRAAGAAEQLGQRDMTIAADGFHYVVVKGVVVTVLTPAMKPKRIRPRA